MGLDAFFIIFHRIQIRNRFLGVHYHFYVVHICITTSIMTFFLEIRIQNDSVGSFFFFVSIHDSFTYD